MKQILFILAVILIFGCIKQTTNDQIPSYQPPNTTTPPTSPNDNGQQSLPNNAESQTTCDEYCHTTTSISCNGSWIISGSYPNCNCQFNCTAIPDEPIELPEPQTEQNNTPANFSLILDNSMDKINDEFYSVHSGMFTEKSSKWKRSATEPSDSIEFTSPEVKFNNVAISSLQASGFFIFEGNSKDIIGTAIFNVDSTPLDSYGFIGAFDVKYTPTLIKRTLLDCRIYNKEYAYSGVIYYFECEDDELN